MKQTGITSSIVAVLGGMAVGAAIALLFAPEKEESLRDDIKQFLKKKGIMPKGKDLGDIVDEIKKQIN